MDKPTGEVNKYGVKLIPRGEKIRPKNVQSLNDDNVGIMEIVKRVLERHKDVFDALAKR